MLEVASMLEQINKNSDISYAIIDLMNAFHSIYMRKEKSNAFTWDMQYYTLAVLPQTVLRLLLSAII